MATPKKFYTGVGLDPEVVDFLAQLAYEFQRPRSWLINTIIREKARSLQVERESQAAGSRQQDVPVIHL